MPSDVLVVYKKNFEEVHDKALAAVRDALDELVRDRGTAISYKARETVSREDFVGRDLVIILGGDGTLTSIAHSIDSDTPVMGVNSHPQDDDEDGSYGFYMGSDTKHFAEDVRSALDGTGIVNVLPRLQAEIVTTSGKTVLSDPALNDLIIANTHQYQPSIYKLERGADGGHGNIDTVQRSSGCLFSTFLGQGAWFRHVVNIEGATFPMDEVNERYLFASRDLPRAERADDGSYWAWTGQPTVMTSDMHRGYIVSDGWDETHFTRGARVTVDLSGPTLQLLTFRRTIHDRVAHWIEP
uniref:ATP-NAD kinase-like protein n=1 Tax=uncultured marine group II euryarchaeote KM3-130-D10 TaxID=526663 RepID=B3V6M2_9ARCH|nr:ATP-NAD kinase-like protein [uncultured marine group II euryarchaeote KM3-130-D10]